MINMLAPIIYTLFILSINALSEPQKAYRGNQIAIFAMIFALSIGIYHLQNEYIVPVFISLLAGALTGIISARKIKMPDLPQMIALLNGFGGLSAGLIGITEFSATNHPLWLIITIIIIGFFTFGGSLSAYLKLSHRNINLKLPFLRNIYLILLILSIFGSFYAYSSNLHDLIGFAVLISLFGLTFVLSIGAADMSIIISILNSFSGWSTVAVGFSIKNPLMIIIGTIIGASGTILSYMMTKAMKRNLIKVLFTPIDKTAPTTETSSHTIRQATPRDAAFLMENAEKIIIVPGYGMAAANAQNELATLTKILKTDYKINVKFAIHPVAGRMPGHMNILLAEADINPDDMFELKDINHEFETTDVVYIIGANDITNPLAKTKKDSPIYQMPILEVEKAKRILFVKRSLSAGYAGVDNPLFYAPNTLMLLGDAKTITQQITTVLEEK